MKIETLYNEVNLLTNKCQHVLSQINALKLVNILIEVEKYNGEEVLVRYNFNTVYEEYIDKEIELLFFSQKFLEEYKKILDLTSRGKSGDTIILPNQEISYYFNGILGTFSMMIEGEQKNELLKYCDEQKVKNIFPSRDKIGIWWEVYMLRNRILHHTSRRYSNGEVCSCYYQFNSKIINARLDSKMNLSLMTTLLDIYKSETIMFAIKKAIISKERINPFDLLFPNTTAKGKEKKNPSMLFITNDIFFDYTTSGIRFLNDMLDFLLKINYLFYKKITSEVTDNEKLEEKKFCIFINGEEKIFSVKEVFENIVLE